MKILIPLMAIILLSSCSNKFSLQKRKYTKGFYFANSKSNNQKKYDLASNKTEIKNLSKKDYSLTKENKNIADAETKPSPALEIVLDSYVTKQKNEDNKKNVTASSSKNTIQVKKAFKELKLNTSKSKLGKAKKGDKDVNFVVMVILCFFWFFNLIPVYLHDNKTFTLNFLITLLLDFTYILGVIYALLVVLDVVDLA